MAVRVGDVYYAVTCEDDGKVRVDEWHVRAIQRKTRGVLKAPADARPRAFMTMRLEHVTWVRTGRGAKATWGWAPRVPREFKRDFDPEVGPGGCLAKSVSQACRLALRDFGPEKEKDWKDDPEMLAWVLKGRKSLEVRLAREMVKKRKRE